MKENVKIRTQAFTLVELLVVISIIALLLAVLMPALSKARKQAANTVCKAQLHSWGLAFGNYAAENGDRICSSIEKKSGMWVTWDIVLKKYYVDDKIRLCPVAAKVLPNAIPTDDRRTSFLGSQYGAWSTPSVYVSQPDVVGSYGMNAFAQAPSDISESYWGVIKTQCWGSPIVNGARNIPLLGDCAWREVVVGIADDARPKLPITSPSQLGAYGQIGRFLIIRHGKGVNFVFLDSSVRNISIQDELFKLSWFRGWKPKTPTRRSWMN